MASLQNIFADVSTPRVRLHRKRRKAGVVAVVPVPLRESGVRRLVADGYIEPAADGTIRVTREALADAISAYINDA